MKLNSIGIILLLATACTAPKADPTLSKEVLMDKIQGGWAGQTIGVVYGAPTEFKHQGTLIPDSQPISWGEGYV
ncbi:MAG: ADP-ribosylglycohydrolase family protein, partial [Bacteroidales bacterium]|nr:ADP-ribosylglycohydrolase family protein [Bacteroidales bacterium]